MKRDILKDKFIAPILITIFFNLFNIKETNDWVFFLILLLALLTILGIVYFFKKDLYIQDFTIENDSLNIQYQKNFSKHKARTFFIDSKSIDSITFSSKSFLDTFHVISIKHINEDGLYNIKTFKTKNDDTFIKIIHHLNLLCKQKTCNT